VFIKHTRKGKQTIDFKRWV